MTTTGATAVNWSNIDVPGGSGTNVPITPRASGVVIASAIIGATNADSAAHTLTVALAIDGGPLDPISTVELGPTGTAASQVAVPVSVEFLGLTPGTTHQITVQATASAANEITLTNHQSSITVQEVPVSTG